MMNNDTSTASIIFNNNASISTIAMVMFFGTILFTTASLVARLWLTGLWRWRNSSQQQQQQQQQQQIDITSLACIYSVLYYFSTLGLILLYSYICEHHPPNYHGEKMSYNSNRDEYYFWIVLVVIVAGGQTVQRNVDIVKKKKHHQQRNKKNNDNGNNDANYSNQPNHQIMTQQQQQQQQQQIWCDETHPPSSSSSTSMIISVDENKQGILNDCQIQEIKGGIQIVFLLYRYYYNYNTNNNNDEMYSIVHFMNTAYLWLLGYTNFTYYYYKTNNYTLSHVLRMVWQINFLVLFTCLTHGNSYLLYYICPLHTYYFLVVYMVLYIGKGNNQTMNKCYWIRMKLGILSIFIYLVWDLDVGLFDMLHSTLFTFTSSSNNNESSILLSDDTAAAHPSMGIKWEWYFRTYLDHWSTLLGMIFALNIPIISLYYQKLEVNNSQWMGKLAVIAGMTNILFLCSPWSKEQQYNFINSYIGWLPLLLYVYLRNITPQIRSYSLEMLYDIGEISMETYIMHHHIWLSSNSNTILVFIKGWPHINLVLVTTIFILLSRQLHTVTINLGDILLPNNDRKACIKSLIGLSVTITGFYCTAYILEGMVIISLPIVGVVSIICGILLYQTVMDLCWTAYRKDVAQKERNSALNGDFEDDYTVTSQSERAEYSTTEQESITDETIYSKFYPPLIGALVLVVLGLTWNEFAITGASAIGPLPARCEMFVNDGMWIEIDGCNESSRSMAYRNYGMASYDRRCVPSENSYIWVWKDQSPNTHCRFGHRDEEQMKHILNQREVIFIGDSMTRYVYHASMRVLNIKDSGAFDATGPKHADIINTLWGTSPINFKWAPLAIDQLSILKEINNRLTSTTHEGGGVNVRQQPDLIVLGGGAWDLLHLYATNEDRQSHAAALNSLGLEMQRARELGIAIVWLIPTTINTRALNTDEKRDHMREEDMERMRWVYANSGILSSATFIIDGPVFTTSRVSESYDGVHYPIQVYSAGAQILFNAMDWLLPPGVAERVMIPPRIGSMANPIFGIVMLILVTIGLVGCDGFLGFSYLASIFVKGVMHYQLYGEAIHLCAPDVVATQTELQSRRLPISTSFKNRHRDNYLTSNDEIIELIGSSRNEVE